LAAKLTETTFEPLDDKDGELTANEAHSVLKALSRGYECLLIGPGLGESGYIQAFLRGILPALSTEAPRGSHRALRALVIDADGVGGAIAGFVAQGADPFDAASLGLYVGSWAGEMVRQELGSAGMLAGDVANALPRAMRDLRGEAAPSRTTGARPDILQMLQNVQAE